MIVISDTSPLITLWDIGKIDVLRQLYGTVVIPSAVEDELRADTHARSADAIFEACSGWLTVRTPVEVVPIEGLDPGETAAIALAKEMHAELLIIDERLGRRVAKREQIQSYGTIGVLEKAAKEGLIDLAEAFERIKQSKFYISHKYLDSRLAADRQVQRQQADKDPSSEEAT